MRLIVADVRSTSTDGIAAGHYFTVAQNYLDLFGAEMDVRIAGGPVYGDRFGNKLIRLPHDYIVGSSAARNKRAVFQNVRALLREAQDDVIVLQCSAVATAYLGLALFKKKETRVYAIQYSTDGVNSVLKRGLYALCRRKISGVICPNAAIGAVRAPCSSRACIRQRSSASITSAQERCSRLCRMRRSAMISAWSG